MKMLTSILMISFLWGPSVLFGQGPGNAVIKFRDATQCAVIPFLSMNNLILLECSINGSDSVWFILDTGATITMADSAFVAGLKLDVSGQTALQSMGRDVKVCSEMQFGFPGITVGGLEVRVADLTQLPLVLGHEFSGILGYDFIRNFVLEIDYYHHQIVLSDPAGYVYEGQGRQEPLEIVDNWPVINVTLSQGEDATVTGPIILDSGSLTALSLKDDKLARKTVSLDISFGIAGAGSGGKEGRVKTVKLAGFELAEVTAGFGDGDTLKMDYLSRRIARVGSGIIGSEVMRRFNWVFDYSHERFYIEPNPDLDSSFESDMSGLFLISENRNYDRFLVLVVQHDSPAAETGFQAGDILLEVNDIPVKTLSLPDLRNQLSNEGIPFRFKVLRGDTIFDLQLKTRRLI